jgi:hypothetical protein
MWNLKHEIAVSPARERWETVMVLGSSPFSGGSRCSVPCGTCTRETAVSPARERWETVMVLGSKPLQGRQELVFCSTWNLHA